MIHDFVSKYCNEEVLGLQLEIFIAKKLRGFVASKRLEEYYSRLMEQYVQLVVAKGMELGFERDLAIFLSQQANNKTNDTIARN